MWKTFCKITIYGDPCATERIRFDTRRGIAYKPTKTRKAMARYVMLIKQHIRKHSLVKIADVPIKVEIDCYHERPKRLLRKKDPIIPILKTTKPDVDNLSKLIMDSATQAGLWEDDNLIVDLSIRDWYVAKTYSPKSVMIVKTFDKGNTMNVLIIHKEDENTDRINLLKDALQKQGLIGISLSEDKKDNFTSNYQSWVRDCITGYDIEGNKRYNGFILIGRYMDKKSEQFVAMALENEMPLWFAEKGKLKKLTEYKTENDIIEVSDE
jgi:Holliday junction resolvase RusA-like endonuclease